MTIFLPATAASAQIATTLFTGICPPDGVLLSGGGRTRAEVTDHFSPIYNINKAAGRLLTTGNLVRANRLLGVAERISQSYDDTIGVDSFAALRQEIRTQQDFSGRNLCGQDLSDFSAPPAKLEGTTIDLSTYRQSGWSQEQLMEWVRVGADIVDLERFPEDVKEHVLQKLPGLWLEMILPTQSYNKLLTS